MPFTPQSNDWEALGAGSSNEAYVSAASGLVFKAVHSNDLNTDTPKRAVFLWNLLNPDLKPKAKLATITVNGEKKTGWTCPYVRSQYHPESFTSIQADRTAYKAAIIDPKLVELEDQAIVSALIDIYNRTGRVVLDAAIPGNFVSIAPGKAICVDVGMALRLEEQEENCLDNYGRRQSIVSHGAWEKIHGTDIGNNILNKPNHLFPKALEMVKALLFIRTYRPDIIHVDFLEKDQGTIAQLAQAYDTSPPQEGDKGLAILNEKRPLDLIQIKKSCTEQLLRYIHARGTLDEGNRFTASWVTSIFRNRLLTKLKVDSAQLLIKKIDSAQSLDALQKGLLTASNYPILQQGRGFGFSTVLGLCKLISDPSPDLRLQETRKYQKQ